MIPRQISLRGFMSYGDELTSISFRGASLWALAGENGAGKSTLFDAMFYALYGEHRLGLQGAQQLIHHGCESLLVECDFAVGEDEYRVRRTLSRKTGKTVQAWYLRGPHAPDPGSGCPQPIAETERESGLKNWVKHVVGLDSQAFPCAVWLQQGKSDALIKASPKERHQLLTQILDLSAYERLHQRAEAASRHWDAEASTSERHVSELEPIEDQHLERVKEQELQVQGAKQAAKDRLLCLAGWRIQAQRWLEGEEERQKLLQTEAACEELLTHAKPD